MDQVALRNADLLILTALTQTPTANPDSMLGEFCMAVGKPYCPFAFNTARYRVAFFSLDSVHFADGRLLPRTLSPIRPIVRPI